MRRILQSQGCEVVHLGHDRSVDDVVTAAIQEDVHGVAVSSYQGGHVEYFEYLVRLLAERGAGHVKVFGGGGGVIVPAEIARLRDVRRPDLLAGGRPAPRPRRDDRLDGGRGGRRPRRRGAPDRPRWPPATTGALARAITVVEAGAARRGLARRDLRAGARANPAPVLGITGTGGSGKSSLTDELLRRFRLDQQDKLRIAVVARRPHPAARRRRAARRPHPDERARARPDVLPLARDPRRPRTRCRSASTTSSPPTAPPATTSSSSRRPASARATPASSTSPTSRST